MGPLASADFVRSIYDASRGAAYERELPRLVLWSDPAVPDRSESLLREDVLPLSRSLVAGVTWLREAGAWPIIICCVTAHSQFDKLPAALRRDVVSLVTVILRSVDIGRRYLILCTQGTRHNKTFERHPLWDQVSSCLVFPGTGDQLLVHQLIYSLKRGACVANMATTLAHLRIGTLRTRLSLHARNFTRFHERSATPSPSVTCGWIRYLSLPTLSKLHPSTSYLTRILEHFK